MYGVSQIIPHFLLTVSTHFCTLCIHMADFPLYATGPQSKRDAMPAISSSLDCIHVVT